MNRNVRPIAWLALAFACAPWAAQAQDLRLISRDYATQAPVFARLPPSISADGNYVAMTSSYALAAAPDTNLREDVFVYDIACERVERVSDGWGGVEGNNDAEEASISGDGRYVAFTSRASNLVPDDVNQAPDVFLFDRATRTLTRVSRPLRPEWPGAGSTSARISADGRFVVFASGSITLLPEGAQTSMGFNHIEIYLYEVATGQVEIVSRNHKGRKANGISFMPQISADGNRVAFRSSATDLSEDYVQPQRQWVHVRDRLLGRTEMVERAPDGTPSDMASDASYAFSGDGARVAFVSRATTLVHDGREGVYVFLRDLERNTIQRVALPSGDPPGVFAASALALSHTGRWVVFHSRATAAGEWRGLYRQDTQSGKTTLLTPGIDGGPENGDSLYPTISADGDRVSFRSYSSNLVSGPSSQSIYLSDRRLWQPSCVPPEAGGGGKEKARSRR